MQYMVQGAIAAITGAISGNANLVATGNWSTDGKKVLTKGMRTFGDRASRVAIWVMNSAAYFDLVDNAIDEKIFEEAGLVVYGGQPGTMGKRVLVTDYCPADTILGLVPGRWIWSSRSCRATGCTTSTARRIWSRRSVPKVRSTSEVLGYAWDADGGAPANLNHTQLGTSSNWTKVATDDKATAGFLIELTT